MYVGDLLCDGVVIYQSTMSVIYHYILCSYLTILQTHYSIARNIITMYNVTPARPDSTHDAAMSHDQAAGPSTAGPSFVPTAGTSYVHVAGSSYTPVVGPSSGRHSSVGPSYSQPSYGPAVGSPYVAIAGPSNASGAVASFVLRPSNVSAAGLSGAPVAGSSTVGPIKYRSGNTISSVAPDNKMPEIADTSYVPFAGSSYAPVAGPSPGRQSSVGPSYAPPFYGPAAGSPYVAIAGPTNAPGAVASFTPISPPGPSNVTVSGMSGAPVAGSSTAGPSNYRSESTISSVAMDAKTPDIADYMLFESAVVGILQPGADGTDDDELENMRFLLFQQYLASMFGSDV